jgi:RHS repeat-associated protein
LGSDVRAIVTTGQMRFGYRFGFNGKEQDNEVKGQGNSLDFGAKIYDSRLGRFLSTDPLMHGIPFQSPYCFAGNQPIWAIDKNGEIKVIVTVTKDDHTYYDENGNPSPKRTVQTITKDYLIIDEILGVHRNTMNIGVTQIAMNDNDPSTGGTQFNIYSAITSSSGGQTVGERMNAVMYGVSWLMLRVPIVGPAVRAAEGRDMYTGRFYSKPEVWLLSATTVTDFIALGRVGKAATTSVAKKRALQMLLTKLTIESGIYGAGKYTEANTKKVVKMLYENGLADDIVEAFANGLIPISKSKLDEVYDAMASGNGENIIFSTVDDLKDHLSEQYDASGENDVE